MSAMGGKRTFGHAFARSSGRAESAISRLQEQREVKGALLRLAKDPDIL